MVSKKMSVVGKGVHSLEQGNRHLTDSVRGLLSARRMCISVSKNNRTVLLTGKLNIPTCNSAALISCPRV